jgi:hypothetical protein
MDRGYPKNMKATKNLSDDPDCLYDMMPEKAMALARWIQHAIKPSSTPERVTSYTLKHLFERVGFYVSNGEFKAVMVIAGYQPIDGSEVNWRFYCEPKCPDADPIDYSRRYLVTHLSECERKELDSLIRYAIELSEEERLGQRAAVN